MIRTATINDVSAIRKMAEIVFPATYSPILTAQQVEFMMDWMYSPESLRRQMEEGHRFFIEDGLGYVSFRPDGRTSEGKTRFHLEKLYVLPQGQKTGLGRRLFETVCEAARAEAGGPCVIELNVNRHNPAVGFYEHLGMVKALQGDFPIGHGFFMNDYIMSIEL